MHHRQSLCASLSAAKPTPYGVNLMNGQAICQAAQRTFSIVHTSSQAVAQAPALPDSQVSLALSMAVSIADFCSLVCNARVSVPAARWRSVKLPELSEKINPTLCSSGMFWLLLTNNIARTYRFRSCHADDAHPVLGPCAHGVAGGEACSCWSANSAGRSTVHGSSRQHFWVEGCHKSSIALLKLLCAKQWGRRLRDLVMPC